MSVVINPGASVLLTPLQVWQDEQYRGLSAVLGYGRYPTAQSMGIGNDTITSLRVGTFTQVTLYENDSYSGRALTIVGPKYISNLKNYTGDFNDLTSSAVVARLEPSLSEKFLCCTGASPAGACGEFTPGTQTCHAAIASYCASNMGSQACQTWCKQNPGYCDSAAISYCSASPSDPFCACINSPVNTTGAINPKCVDRKCLETGYLTSGMLSTNCPSIVNCDVQTIINNSGIIADISIPIQQNCGAPGVSVLPTNSAPTHAPERTPGPTLGSVVAAARSSPNFVLYVLVFLLVVFVAVVGAFLLDWDTQEPSEFGR